MSSSGKLAFSNLLACILAVLWACSSAVYNWGNIGGWVSPYFEEWVFVGEVVPYTTLIAWFASIVLSIYFASSRPCRVQFGWVLASFVSVPIIFFATDWICHRGFPQLSM